MHCGKTINSFKRVGHYSFNETVNFKVSKDDLKFKSFSFSESHPITGPTFYKLRRGANFHDVTLKHNDVSTIQLFTTPKTEYNYGDNYKSNKRKEKNHILSLLYVEGWKVQSFSGK